MRLKLTISPSITGISIPLSYEYYLATVIYRWIELSSTAFAEFLHKQGYTLNGYMRRFKNFCFSQLFPERSRVINDHLHIFSGTINWYIGIPVEEAVKHLVVGMFEKHEFFIGREINKFLIQQVEILPEPVFTSSMKFKTLSPITVSVVENDKKNINNADKKKIIARYLKADDPKLSDALRNNLLLRYEALYNKKPESDDFRCLPDEEYIRKRGGVNRVSKLVTIKQDTTQETKVRGFRCPVTLEGSTELVKLAYDSGLGEKGSMGFGMLEVV